MRTRKDADVYGPSIPHLLGVNDRPYLENQRLQPVVKDGLRVMSMGFLVPPGEAVVWRDTICAWIFRLSGIPDDKGRVAASDPKS